MVSFSKRLGGIIEQHFFSGDSNFKNFQKCKWRGDCRRGVGRRKRVEFAIGPSVNRTQLRMLLNTPYEYGPPSMEVL